MLPNQLAPFHPCFLPSPFLPTVFPISVHDTVILPVAQVKNLGLFFLDFSHPPSHKAQIQSITKFCRLCFQKISRI